MRRSIVMALLAAGAVTVASMASAAGNDKPRTVSAGNLEVTFNGGFNPNTLPKRTLAPIALNVAGKVSTKDGSHPPALKEALIETDKNGSVTTIGLPRCTAGKLQAQDTRSAESICRTAIIGKGVTNVEIALPEQKPIPVKSDLLVFNGGTSGGVTTFFIHAFITVPTPAAIVTAVKIKKISNGRYGLLSVAKIPKIAGGNGAVTSFSLLINKKYTYKGKKLSVLSAKCPDGKLQARGTALFADGTKASAGIVRTCTGTS